MFSVGALVAYTLGMNVLSHDLNRAILKNAPKFEAQENAPYTFESLKSNVGRLVVWSGASDKTIYGDAKVNHAFRAWHDKLHLELNAPFTLEGEKLVAMEQARLVGSDTLGLILIGEIVGQAEFFNKNGYFPIDQMGFMLNYLKGMR